MSQVIYEMRVPVFDHDEVKPNLSLLIVFLEHDQTCGTSVSYDFSNSWANWRVAFFVYDCETEFSNDNSVISNQIDIL